MSNQLKEKIIGWSFVAYLVVAILSQGIHLSHSKNEKNTCLQALE